MGGLIDVINIPPTIGLLISSRIATLKELQTFYGLRDAYDLLEVLNVDMHNKQRVEEWQKMKL